MLDIFDIYLMNIEHHLEMQGITGQEKQKILKRISRTSETWDCFKPVTEFFTAEDEENDDEGLECPEAPYIASETEIDERIRGKQAEIGLPLSSPRKKADRREFGRTDLIHAVMLNDIPAVRNALSKGVNPKARDNNGNTAYTLAALHENFEMMKTLEGLNADRL